MQTKKTGYGGDWMRPAKRSLPVICLAALIFFGATAPATAGRPLISAYSAVLMDAGTGQVLFEKKMHARREPASLTKIITAVLALEYGHLEEVVTVGQEPARITVGQELHLAKGDRITLENLLKAALLHSANDSTVAIAQHISGSEEKFVETMNTKALVLGALNTRFANTNGYHHPNHYTTAYDLALITRYAMQNEKFAELVNTARTTIEWADGKRRKEVGNTNGLVRDRKYEGICGVKTGTTARAGNCLIAAANRGNRLLIAVILHSRNRYGDATKLLDYGFHQTAPVSLCRENQVFGTLPVTGGEKEQVRAVSQRPVEIYMSEEDREQLTQKIIFDKPPQAPVAAGQKLGTVIFYLYGIEVARVNLAAAEAVKRPGILYRLKNVM